MSAVQLRPWAPFPPRHLAISARAIGSGKFHQSPLNIFAAKYFVGWFVYPNVTFNVFPGCPNVTIYNMMPTGPQTTHEYLDFLLPQKTPTEEEMAAIKYLDDVLQPEDIDLVESVQRGLNSRGYNQSRYVVDAERSDQSEHALHHFHSLVLKSLEG
ncbi:MAG: hypothetical protein JNL25_03830 [Rhodospirillaceae bacterium]|nr:hypothetical protein [Rhodospirillaceae bacterium]